MKNKKIKRILALLLSVVMVTVLVAACGGTDEPAPPVGGDPTPAPADPTPAAPTPEPPAEDAFNAAWDAYVAANYEIIADEIAALEQWIHEGIMDEINSGLFAGGGDTTWGNVTAGGIGTAHLPDSEDPPITFTIYVAGPGEVPSRNNKVLQEITRITGVTLEWEYTPGDIDQKVGVIIAGQEYADWIAASQYRGQFLNAGAFLDLDGLIQHYPNLWRHFSLYEQRLRNATLDNSIRLLDIWGRQYNLNDGADVNHEADYNGPAFWIQKDVLAWDDFANPTTLDQFFDLLERYTAAHPDIDGMNPLPFEIFSTDWRSFSLKNPPQHLIGGRNEGDVVVHPGTYEVEIYQDKWYARDYYRILNDAFHRGLIHPETFTRTHDDFMSVIAQGRVLAMFHQHWAFGEGEDVLIADGRIDRTYVPLGLTFDRDEPFPYNRQTHAGIQGGNGGGISVNCENPERFLKFLDTLLMPEVTILLEWGFVDEDFYVDENGRFRRTLEQKALRDDPDWRRDNSGDPLVQNFPGNEGRLPCGNATGPGGQPEERLENMQDYDKWFYSHYFLPDGNQFTQRADFLPQFEHPGYSEVWSLLSTMDSDAPERDTFDLITDAQDRYLPGVIMTPRG